MGYEIVRYDSPSQLNYLDKIFVVILRDPVDRWFSGVAQWYHNMWIENFKKTVSPNAPLILDPFTIELLSTIVKIEEHTELQTYWIKNLDSKKNIFFNISDKKFKADFEHFLITKLRLNNSQLSSFKELNKNNKNKTDESSLKSKVIEQLKMKLSARQKARILDFYEEDICFIKNCNFYQSKESL